ncbi:MAG: hypothetical protein HC866_10265 [Leptolyngbyaceae cyanobacterium RU_5_1]|nr:hypothetical protein [Leptolyngbyaceae cyanobacterium RU_5_1]
MNVVICPGVHEPQLTQSFLERLWDECEDSHPGWAEPLIFPADHQPAYSGLHILWFLHDRLQAEHPHTYLTMPLLFISFSAGVAGAIAASWGWQQSGGTVSALIALDGWGVPLWGNFPIHRLSHDSFTHWSLALLGNGSDSFYADPGVGHLDLWRSPHTAYGWWMSSNPQESPKATTAARFLAALLHRYSDQAISTRRSTQ